MPLVGIGACVSLQFAFLQAGKRYFTYVEGMTSLSALLELLLDY